MAAITFKKILETAGDNDENLDYKKLYDRWVKDLHQDKQIFDFNAEGEPVELKDRKELVENRIKALANDIIPFIESTEKANEVSMTVKRVVAAYDELSEMRYRIRQVVLSDITRFEKVFQNLNKLLE